VLLSVDAVTVDGLNGSSGTQTIASDPCLT
jgi:hypothetical protein